MKRKVFTIETPGVEGNSFDFNMKEIVKLPRCMKASFEHQKKPSKLEKFLDKIINKI